MRLRTALALLSLAPAALAAQHAPGAAPPIRTAPAEAKQFDFLLGQWELTVRPQGTSLAARIHGLPKMLGTWKAWRALDGWAVIDELRITDASGNPQSLTSALRLYDAAARRWSISTADAYRSKVTESGAEWSDGRMVASSKGVDPDGKAYLARSRYSDITGTAFKFEQERSVDDGKTWTKTLIIEAKRVAAAASR